MVDVADIFDEFGYGLVSPQAIKDFITYAYENWQAPAPQYVLLVGDTTYDYKDNRNLGTVNYVPGYLIYTTHLGETISDDWYVQVSGADAVPDLYIGRLPANSAAQAEDDGRQDRRLRDARPTPRAGRRRWCLRPTTRPRTGRRSSRRMNEDAAALSARGHGDARSGSTCRSTRTRALR